jgi:hypothetical protein
LLVGTRVAWAKLILLKLGVDSTAEDANAWLPPMSSEAGSDDITDADLEQARQQLVGQSRGQGLLRKSDILATQVEILFRTPTGQEAIRSAVRERKVPREIVRQILDGEPSG